MPFTLALSHLGTQAHDLQSQPDGMDQLRYAGTQRARREAVDTARQWAGQPPKYAKPCTFSDECAPTEYCSAQWTCLSK